MKKRSTRRDPAKERFWRGTLREQADSGQSVRAFCRGRQLTEATFYFWRRELKQRNTEKGSLQPGRLGTDTPNLPVDAQKKPDAKLSARFVPLVAEPLADVTAATIEMILPSGSVLRWPGGATATVAEMITALEARLC